MSLLKSNAGKVDPKPIDGLLPFIGASLLIGTALVVGAALNDALRQMPAQASPPMGCEPPVEASVAPAPTRNRGLEQVITLGAFLGVLGYLLHVNEALPQIWLLVKALTSSHTTAAFQQAMKGFEPNSIILVVIWGAMIVFPPAGLLLHFLKILRR